MTSLKPLVGTFRLQTESLKTAKTRRLRSLGKVGIGIDVAEDVNIYGEISFITDEDDNGYGTKFGVTYSF